MRTLKLGTRGSPLALFQARAVAAALDARAGITCEIVVIKTSGDQLAEAPLAQAGGKRLFVKEIEDALLSSDVDLAVHSAKDMPAVSAEGLTVAAVLLREDPRDAFVLPAGHEPGEADMVLRRLGDSPRIGTSSIRRTAQLTRLVAGARFVPVRGNLDTRLRKLDEGRYDALVLAAAGLRRLGYAARLTAPLAVDACVPAPGQGIIAVEIRSGDSALADAVGAVNDTDAAVALAVERAVVEQLGGGCQMPIGVHASTRADQVSAVSVVIAPDGRRMARAAVSGPTSDPRRVGIRAAEQLLGQGAGDILGDARRALSEAEGRRS